MSILRRIGIGVSALILAGAFASPALASKPLPGQPSPVESGHKITICHRTSSNNPGNYWLAITVDVASSGGLNKLEGHDGHTTSANNRGRLDVIPAFTYGSDSYAGASDPGNWGDWYDWINSSSDNAAAAEACSGGEEGGGVGG